MLAAIFIASVMSANAAIAYLLGYFKGIEHEQKRRSEEKLL